MTWKEGARLRLRIIDDLKKRPNMIPECLNTTTNLTPGQMIELVGAPGNLGNAKNKDEEHQMTSSKHTQKETRVSNKIKVQAAWGLWLNSHYPSTSTKRIGG